MTVHRTRALAVLAAAALAVVIWLIAVPLLGADLLVEDRSGKPVEIGIGPVLLFSLGAGLAGWGLLALLERITARAKTVWTVIAVVVLLLSFGPLTDSSISGGTRLVLGSMHLAVAVVLIPALTRMSGPGRGRADDGGDYSKTGQSQSRLNAPR